MACVLWACASALWACASATSSAPGVAPTGAIGSSTTAASPLLQPVTPAELAAVLRAPGARLSVVNVWATWCEPCVREFPDILRAGREAAPRGVRTVFVSVDFEAERPSAEAFLRGQGVDFTTYVKSGDDQAFIDGLSREWSGSIPATMLFDAQGNLRYFREGDIDHATLSAAIDAVLE